MSEKNLLIIWIIIWIIIWYLIAKIIFQSYITKLRKQSIQQSKAVISGQVYEKIAPLLPEFPYNPKDLTFIGKWIDYIIFDWLDDWNIKQIVFLEIKTWKSKLNSNEKIIKKAIEKGNFRYEIMKL